MRKPGCSPVSQRSDHEDARFSSGGAHQHAGSETTFNARNISPIKHSASQRATLLALSLSLPLPESKLFQSVPVCPCQAQDGAASCVC